ncbi:hypothetical protein B566_EDAN006452 [Ephemera danica]|nr:hypothetical protein B566_EDAN006452 [Ephemera danica]
MLQLPKMKLLLVLVFVALAAANPEEDDPLVKEIDKELDNILEMSTRVEKMDVEELRKLSAQVDNTMKRLENFAEKRLGMNLAELEAKAKRVRRQDESALPAPAVPAAPVAPIAPAPPSGVLNSFLNVYNELYNGVSSGVSTGASTVGGFLSQLGSLLNGAVSGDSASTTGGQNQAQK